MAEFGIDFTLLRALLSAAAIGMCQAGRMPVVHNGLTAAGVAVVGPLALLAFGVPATPRSLFLGAALAFLVGSLVALIARRSILGGSALAIVLVLVSFVWMAGLLPGPLSKYHDVRQSQLNVEYQPETYGFDGDDFLATRQFMLTGMPYYDAFRSAVEGDVRHDPGYLRSPFNYREPLVFLVWAALPGATPHALLLWFIAYACVVLVLSFVVASSLVDYGAALLAPLTLLTMLVFFAWSSSWFTVTEVWSIGFVLAGLAALLRRRPVTSVVLLMLAVASREFMILFLPAWLLYWWATERGGRRWWFPVSVVAAPTLALAAHVVLAPSVPGAAKDISMWLHGGVPRLLAALRFGWFAAVQPASFPVLLVAIAVAGAVMIADRPTRYALIAAVVFPTMFLLGFSHGVSADYWGAFFTPVAAAIAPSAFARLLPVRRRPSTVMRRLEGVVD